MAENTNSPPAVVIDASAILAKLLPDEEQFEQVEDYYQHFAKNELNFLAPTLLRFEVTNALRSAVVRERISAGVAGQLLAEFLKLPIYYEESNFLEVFNIALQHNLSAYDASYVALALSREIGLVSLDRRLADTVN